MIPFKFLHKQPTEDEEIRNYLLNNLPRHIILSGEIGAYMYGVDSAIMSMPYNPFTDTQMGFAWNRGFWDTKELIKRRNENI